MGLLDGLLGSTEDVEPPASDLERRKLDHERRKLEREIRDLEKALDRTSCSTCAKSPIRQDRLQISKALDAKRTRLEEIEARLAAS